MIHSVNYLKPRERHKLNPVELRFFFFLTREKQNSGRGKNLQEMMQN